MRFTQWSVRHSVRRRGGMTGNAISAMVSTGGKCIAIGAIAEYAKDAGYETELCGSN